jgi:hypothetical protein
MIKKYLIAATAIVVATLCGIHAWSQVTASKGTHITVSGASLVFNYTTFTGSTPVTSIVNGGTGNGVSGGVVYIAQGNGHHQGGSVWNNAQVNIQSFTMNATFTLPTYNVTLTAGSPNITLPSNNGFTSTQTATFTASSASIAASNNFVAGLRVTFSNSGGALPTGISAGTQYYVLSTGLTGSTFEISLTNGGSAVVPSSAGTGTQTVTYSVDGIKFGGNFSNVTGLTQYGYYYIVQISTTGGTTTIQVSSTAGGTPITLGGTGTASASIVPIVGAGFSVQTSTNTTQGGSGYYGLQFTGDANLSGIGGYATSGGTQYPLGNSINIKLDMGACNQTANSYGPGQTSNTISLTINGGPFNCIQPVFDLNPYGLDLHSGDLMSINVVYDGSNLDVTIADTVTSAQARFIWPMSNLTSIVGGNTAYVGFTSGMIPAAQAWVSTWSYSTGYNPRLSAPSFGSVTPGLYSSSQTVTLTAAAGATIYYSTNGLPPTSSSTQYTGPFTVSSTQNIQAIAVKSGYTTSYPSGGVFEIASGSPPNINFPSGFASAVSSGQMVLNGYPFISGSNLQLSQAPGAQVFNMGSAWYAVPQTISTFTSNFTFSASSLFNNGGGSQVGFLYCLQNYYQSPTTYNTPQDGGWVTGGPSWMFANAVSPTSSSLVSGMGYAAVTNQGSLVANQTPGLGNSVCVAFDLTAGSYGGVGEYSGGAPPTGNTVNMASTMNLSNGDPYSVALSYDGTTLSLLMTDTLHTSNTYSTSWTVNIPSLVGGSTTAYAGFVTGEGYSIANIALSNWTMYMLPVFCIPRGRGYRRRRRSKRRGVQDASIRGFAQG